jgi:predicted RNase H-like HicB family nuclease
VKKKITRFYVVFDAIPDGGFNVSFPEFPGCVTFGNSFEEAREKAREVLELWLEEMSAAGENIPVFESRPIIDEVKVRIPTRIRTARATPHR